ncbi:YpmS family protein [Streptococcus hongkongensis]|nr:membrane protein [Streptococcus uberis]
MKRSETTKKLKNKWKLACLFLIAFNFALVLVIGSRLIQVREPNSQKLVSTVSNSVKVGTISTNRSQINKTVASYLQDYQKKDLIYKIYTTSSAIIFEGKYQFLGYEVPLYIYFQPIALEDGSLQLQVSSISAGTLPLPESEVLQYIKSTYKLPSFVTVNSKKSSIIVNLQEIKNGAGIYLKAKKVDLINNQITFDIYKKKA